MCTHLVTSLPMLLIVCNFVVLRLELCNLCCYKCDYEWQHASTDTICKLHLTIVQPHLEYACEIWDPHLAKDCQMIESIQKFASRVCLKQWSGNTRYQDMLEFLNMPSLAACKGQRKLCTLYKIVNNLSEYPSSPIIPRILITHPEAQDCLGQQLHQLDLLPISNV